MCVSVNATFHRRTPGIVYRVAGISTGPTSTCVCVHPASLGCSARHGQTPLTCHPKVSLCITVVSILGVFYHRFLTCHPKVSLCIYCCYYFGGGGGVFIIVFSPVVPR